MLQFDTKGTRVAVHDASIEFSGASVNHEGGNELACKETLTLVTTTSACEHCTSLGLMAFVLRFPAIIEQFSRHAAHLAAHPLQ